MTDYKAGTPEQWLGARLELLQSKKEYAQKATSWRGGRRRCRERVWEQVKEAERYRVPGRRYERSLQFGGCDDHDSITREEPERRTARHEHATDCVAARVEG